MKKSDIIVLPDLHLRERSKKVGLVSDEIKSLIQGMQEATLDWEDSRHHEVGVALAAIQVDQPYRVVVIRNDFDNKKDRTFSVFINPVITKLEGELLEDFEGCLSVPEIYGKVKRYDRVRIKAMDEGGREVRLTADGFLARVFQHEIDHTNGIVFVDHIKDNPGAFFRLKEDGHLEKLDYEKDIKTNSILW
ncbi:MAG TPA: peptide deformylase [Candidatus Pristimantibacillus sp.]|jgi:peptide deformylase|nr:peptide deformylase [Candidatus Pristimantibacillus sp.]